MKHKTRLSPRGQSLVFMALAMVAFLGFVALAIDGGHLLTMRRRARTSADAAALAAANAWVRNADWTTAAKAMAKKDGFDSNDANVTVQVTNLDQNTCQQLSHDNGSGNCTCFKVDIQAQTPTIFAQFVGHSATTTSAVAVSHACKEVPLENGYTIRSRDDLKVKDGGGAMAWGRVRSDSNIIRTGMGHLWSFQGFPFPFGGEITAGKSIKCNSSFMFCNPMMNMMAIGPQVPIMGAAVSENTPRPPMTTTLTNLPKPEACSTVVQPIPCSEITGVDSMETEMNNMMNNFMSAAGGMPSISSFSSFTGSDSASDMFNSFQGTMGSMFNDFKSGTAESCKVYPPGQYNTAIHVSSGEAAIFLPGAHCFAQDVTIDGHAMGLNQTFYFENGSGITLGNGSTVALDAGTPPFDWGGMLFYNPGHVTLSKVSGSMLVGSIYAPNGNCNLTGGGMMMGWSQLLCKQVDIQEGFQVMIAFDADHVYHVPAEISLVK